MLVLALQDHGWPCCVAEGELCPGSALLRLMWHCWIVFEVTLTKGIVLLCSAAPSHVSQPR